MRSSRATAAEQKVKFKPQMKTSSIRLKRFEHEFFRFFARKSKQFLDKKGKGPDSSGEKKPPKDKKEKDKKEKGRKDPPAESRGKVRKGAKK